MKNLKNHILVILSVANNLVFSISSRSFTSFRMTAKRVFQQPANAAVMTKIATGMPLRIVLDLNISQRFFMVLFRVVVVVWI